MDGLHSLPLAMTDQICGEPLHLGPALETILDSLMGVYVSGLACIKSVLFCVRTLS